MLLSHLRCTLCLLMLHSLILPCFPFCLLLRVRGRMKIYWFIMFPYQFLLQLPFLSHYSVYSRRQNPLVSSLTPAILTLDPISNDDHPIALHKGKHQYVHPISSFCSYNHFSSHSCSFIASLDSISLPNNVPKALSHPGWYSAMIKEKNSLNDNGTWDLVQLAVMRKVIGCPWVFVVKVNPSGSVARLKAHLVAKGYAQTYGVDYYDTFSLVSKMTYVRLFISLATTHG